MSQHRSLRAGDVSVKRRNVLKRFERIKAMSEPESKQQAKSAYNLPKLRPDKVKGGK
ncbi:MAG: small basic protein [Candidatus Omnitrophica bacterium]|nr:small basic protein [Candidatus Omnitrophota bacterium]